jgi:hypothetical protein
VEVTGIEPVTPCLQIQKAKLDAVEPDEKEEEREKTPAKSTSDREPNDVA